MELTEEVKIVFRNKEGDKKELTITVDKLLDSTRDDLYEMLEETHRCTSAGCYTEGQNFCDCGPSFEDYSICEVLL